MTPSTMHDQDRPAAGRDEMMAALFANLVLQQTNLALMMLGKVPHPQTGQTMQDLDAARMFIDQLEMLEAKTKGNLAKAEEQLLKQNLMAVRLAFVEAIEQPPAAAPVASAAAAPSAEEAAPPIANQPETAPPTPPTEEESRKKFSKKY